ncbi:putative phage holin [Streptomyces sp. cg35]|uniref:putative phage holin n=1 Tax=Streptomyces sp. cg35 TaxID=3421650 RepID=UPI003D1730D8
MRDITVDQWINIGGSTIAAIACLVFMVSYHAKATWWRGEIGRNLMLFAAAVGLLCTYTVLISFWPDGCFAIVMRGVRTVTVLAIATLMIQRTRLLLKAQREHPGA